MRILAVSNDLSFLSELTDVLKKIVPEADVIKETDPLMAGDIDCNLSFFYLLKDDKKAADNFLITDLKHKY